MTTHDDGWAGLWRSHGLALVLLGLFLASLIGQAVSGWAVYNAGQRDHRLPETAFGPYLVTAHFWESVSENWESEFLQLSALVVLTVFLRERGSAESAVPGIPAGPQRRTSKVVPFVPRWRRTGLGRRLYEHSLSVAFVVLFLTSFAIHVVSGAHKLSAEEQAHGRAPITAVQFLSTPQLWFESMQNWQSEFLASGLLVVLTVYLREKGSSQSKPVRATRESNEA